VDTKSALAIRARQAQSLDIEDIHTSIEAILLKDFIADVIELRVYQDLRHDLFLAFISDIV